MTNMTDNGLYQAIGASSTSSRPRRAWRARVATSRRGRPSTTPRAPGRSSCTRQCRSGRRGIIPRETYAQSPYRLPLPPATRQEGRRPRQPPTPPRPTTRHNTRGTPTRGRSSLTTSSPVGERRTHGLAHLAALRQGPFAQRETLPAGPPKGPRPRASWTTGQP